jgi:hypothetical protein
MSSTTIQHRIFAIAGALALLLAFSPVASAVPSEVFEGAVTGVRGDAVAVLGPRDVAPRVFNYNIRSLATRNGSPARLSDLRPGDAATVWFRPLGDKLLIERIRVVSPPPPGEPLPLP